MFKVLQKKEKIYEKARVFWNYFLDRLSLSRFRVSNVERFASHETQEPGINTAKPILL